MKYVFALLFTLLPALLLGQTNYFEFSIDAAAQTIRLVNHHPTAGLIGFHLSGKYRDITSKFEDHPMPPGTVFTSRLRGSQDVFQLDGAVFDDGKVEGPNRWGIDRHIKAYQDMKAGKPVWADSRQMDESGTSYVWIRRWAQMYEREFGIKPDVRYIPDRAKPDTQLSTIVGWATVSTLNGFTFPIWTQVCDEFGPMPLTYDVECGGTGQCTQPNYWIPNKQSVFVYNLAEGLCYGGQLAAHAQLQNVGTPPGYNPIGNYYVGDSYSSSKFAPQFSGYNTYDWETDSCIAKQQQGQDVLWECPPDLGPPPGPPGTGGEARERR